MKQNTKVEEFIDFDIQIQPFCNQILFPKAITIQENTKSIVVQQQVDEKNKGGSKEYIRPKSLKTKQSTEGDEKDKEKQENQIQNLNANQNQLTLQINFKSAFKDATYFLVLINNKKTDIRVFKIPITVYPKISKATLEMRVPVGEEVKQDIPILNNSENKDWMIKIQWITNTQETTSNIGQFMQQQQQSKHELYFHGARELQVRKKTTQNYTISFRPLSVCEQKCKIILMNALNNDQFEYDLIGIGEEPLAVDHLVINCVARQSIEQQLIIVNPYRDKVLTYEVDSDLSCFEAEQCNFSIQPQKEYVFKFHVRPLLGGVYGGAITFYEKDNKDKFIWYTIVVNAERPRNEQSVDLITQVRKPIIFEILLKNPSNEIVMFDVNIQGEYLTGSNQFQLEPYQELAYELMFSPLKELKSQGNVAFLNEKLGELWYLLNLVSEKASCVRLQQVKAEIGKEKSIGIVLENPSDKEAIVSGVCSNNQNFVLIPSNIHLQAYSEAIVNLVYSPSEIDKQQSTDVIFKSDMIGEWYFMASGIGILPTQFEVKIIHAQLNQLLSDHIVFKNPFKDILNLTVHLENINNENKEQNEVFQLLVKKKQISVMSQQQLSIPFSFHPKQISSYEVMLVLSLNEKIQWRYPIRGVTESSLSSIVYNFVTKARENLEQDIQVQLPGLPKNNEHLQQLRFRAFLNNVPEEYKNIISKDFQILPLKKELLSLDDYLVYNIKFHPMKPLRINHLELIIECEQGGRWKFRINLESLQPEPDDIISIESPLNRTTSVCFKLSNKIKQFSTFSAYFTKDSDPEFNVTPTNGELEPIGREPKNFIVSFLPTEYGKSSTAKLIIETEFLYWSFQVKGTFPQYKPPTNLQHKIDDKLQKNVNDQWNELKQNKVKNHIQNNLKNRQINSPKKEYINKK